MWQNCPNTLTAIIIVHKHSYFNIDYGEYLAHCTEVRFASFLSGGFTKGQLISKAIYGLLTSPKKRMDEFVLFAFLLFMANKSNSSVRFLGESTARQSAF